ncbi:thymidine kinase [Acrasis kona]|uniref:Thymidine kinase n=1 Tax=Acrasis kona TaxID=1008807 RepID=A0AAW2Z267_9EUKA
MDSEMSTTYNGNIQLIMGPMFAGKSTELLRRVKRYQIAKKKCLLIKYVRDDRFSKDSIATHDNQKVVAIPTDILSKIGSTIYDYDVIAVDEGQFFPDLVEFCEKAANLGKIVIVSALDGTFQRKPFPVVIDLIPLCESVVKLNAVCMICQHDAAFSKRITNDTATEVIGGSDMYVAVCRRCYMTDNIHNKETLPEAKQQQKGGMGIGFSPKKIRFVNQMMY